MIIEKNIQTLREFVKQKKLFKDAKLLDVVSNDYLDYIKNIYNSSNDSTDKLVELRKQNKNITDENFFNTYNLAWGDEYKQKISTKNINFSNTFLSDVSQFIFHNRFADLFPCKIIPEHRDDPYSFRFILMIKGTHIFETELNNSYAMKEKELWFINGSYKHKITNPTSYIRTALLGNITINEYTTNKLLRIGAGR